MDDGAASIAVPPLSAATLVETIALVLDSSPESLTRADSILTAWERTEPNFCPLLLEVAFNGDQEQSSQASEASAQQQRLTVRIGAIIRLKNVCDKFWRPRVVSRIQFSLSDEVKAHARQTLLERVLFEKDRTIAVQATLCIAKIARTDFPVQWPDLFDVLQARMDQAHKALLGQPSAEEQIMLRLVLLRAAEVCSRSLKVLASVRLLASKFRMTELSRQLLPTLHPIFTELFQSNMPASLDVVGLEAWTSTPLLTERIRTSHLLLKCLTHLAVADMGLITARATSYHRNQTSSSSDPKDADGVTATANIAQAFFRSMPMFLQQVFDLRSALVTALLSFGPQGSQTRTALQPLLSSLTKHLIAFSKLFLALIERDKSKAARWDGWSEVVLWYWSRASEYDPQAGRSVDVDINAGQGLEDLSVGNWDADADASTQANADPGASVVLPARLVIHALVLLRLTIMELKRPGTSLPPSGASLMADDFLISVLETVLSRHMLLTPSTLFNWLQEPENWVVAEGNGADTVSTPADGSAGDEVEVRHAAERLVLAIVQAKKRAGERVWSLFQSLGPPSSLEACRLANVLQRDALYNALGGVMPYLSDTEARTQEAVQRFLTEAALTASGEVTRTMPAGVAPSTWRIIRRRVLQLFAAWVENIPATSLAASFPVVLSLLQGSSKDTDLVIRLTAASTLCQLVDTPNFKAEMLSPYMSGALRSLCQLVAPDSDDELEDLSSIRTCTRALTLITECMGVSVAPHVPTLVELLPGLWERDDEQCRIRPGLLVLTGRILSAVALIIPTQGAGNDQPTGAISRQQIEALHSLAAHMIEHSLQPSTAPLIGVDALMLWIRALASSPFMTAPLFSLLQYAPALLSSPDYTQHVCTVITSSALLAPRLLVLQHGDAIWAETATLVADEMASEITHVLKMVDEVVLAIGSDIVRNGLGEDANLWAEVAVRSGLAHALIGAALHFQEAAVIGAAFISTVARIASTCQPGVFLHIVRDSASKLATTVGAGSAEEAYPIIGKKLVTLLCERFENMSSRHRRRLVALALATILQDANPSDGLDGFIYESIPEMITPWTEVLEDEKERAERHGDGPRPDSPLQTLGDDIEDAEWLDDLAGEANLLPETARWSALRETDPARSGAVAVRLSSVLGAAQSKAPEQFNAAMSRVDTLVLDMLTRGLQAPEASAAQMG